MESRSESVWIDARNALIDLVCVAVLAPVPLPLAWWFSFVAYEARAAVTLGVWPDWSSPHVAAADAWSMGGAIGVILVAYSLAGGTAAKAPNPWRRLLRAVIWGTVLAGAGIALLYSDPFGNLDRQMD